MLQHKPLVMKFRFDTAENELSEVEISTIFGNFDELAMNKISVNVSVVQSCVPMLFSIFSTYSRSVRAKKKKKKKEKLT